MSRHFETGTALIGAVDKGRLHALPKDNGTKDNFRDPFDNFNDVEELDPETLNEDPYPCKPLESNMLLLNSPLPNKEMETEQQEVTAKERTVYISQIDCTATEGQLMELFSACGTVMKVRLCGDPSKSTQYGFVEFEQVSGAKNLLRYDGQKFGKQKKKLQCSLSRQTIRDHDPTDADSKRGKTCTFGEGLQQGVFSTTPLSNSGVQQQKAVSNLSAKEMLETPEKTLLPYLSSISEPLEILIALIHVGVDRPDEVVATLDMWVNKGGLMNAWITQAYRIVLQETKAPVKLMDLGKKLIEAKILGPAQQMTPTTESSKKRMARSVDANLLQSFHPYGTPDVPKVTATEPVEPEISKEDAASIEKKKRILIGVLALLFFLGLAIVLSVGLTQ